MGTLGACNMQTVQAKKVKKTFFPWNSDLTCLMMATKIFKFWPYWSKLGVPKNDAKVPYFEANLRGGSRFCLLRKTFFPQNPQLAGLMMATKIFQFWPFWPKLLRFKVAFKFGTLADADIWVKCEPVGIFFWHFSLLVPAHATRGREIIEYKRLFLTASK